MTIIPCRTFIINATIFILLLSCTCHSFELRSAVATSTSDPDYPPELLVSTSQGNIQGMYNELGVRQWKGIPYAKPPVDDLRWEYPQQPDPLSDTYVANYNAPGCQQVCKLPPGNCPEYGQDEDCLYLTVMAPTDPPPTDDGYPVLFWIHGGAFEQGLGNCALYNGTQFALNGVVTVVINYRLGALGFLASKSMQGNYGFMDQRMAMQWTQSNIRAFGGDPNRVTIAGQSAGSQSVSCHLTSPNSQGYFHQAIQESNPLALPYHDRKSAAKNANDIAAYMGCEDDDVACMKTKSVEEILDAQENAIKLDLRNLFINFVPFAPLVEQGGEIPDQPLYALQGGKLGSMPLLSGSLFDEGQLFVYELFTKPVSRSQYKVIVEGLFGKEAGKQVLDMYPYDTVPGSTDGRETMNIFATDLMFYCPLRNVSTSMQQYNGNTHNPTYIYRFKHVLSFDCWGENYTFCVGSCCHGSDLPFVFNVYDDGVSVDYDPTAAEESLTRDMGNAWTNFITGGDPNYGRPIPIKYPLYDHNEDTIVILDQPGMYIDSHVRDEYCDMWDSLGYIW